MIRIASDYLASRQTFIAQANAVGAHTRSFLHGIDAETAVPLVTDVALFGARDAEVLIVVGSGTHGVEGYAGAACQVHFMERYGGLYTRRQLGFFLVHAVNPWGFLHDRRVTEDNIDLNRNFIEFDQAVEPASRYSVYHDRLVSNYRPWPWGLWNEIRLMAGALTPKRWKEAQAAITAGQHTHADGLFYGGMVPAEAGWFGKKCWVLASQTASKLSCSTFIPDWGNRARQNLSVIYRLAAGSSRKLMLGSQEDCAPWQRVNPSVQR